MYNSVYMNMLEDLTKKINKKTISKQKRRMLSHGKALIQSVVYLQIWVIVGPTSLPCWWIKDHGKDVFAEYVEFAVCYSCRLPCIFLCRVSFLYCAVTNSLP